MTVLIAILTLVVALLGVLVAGLLRSHAEILRRLHDLGAGVEDEAPPAAAGSAGSVSAAAGSAGSVPHRASGDDARTARAGVLPSRAQRPGRRAADVVGRTPEGGPLVVRTVDVTHDTLLLFLSSGCVACDAIWSGLADGDVRVGAGVRLVVVTRGAAAERPGAIVDLAPAGVTVVMSDAAWEDHNVRGSPYAVHVHGPSGRVRGEGTGADWPQIARLLAEATGDLGYVGAARGRRRTAAADARREARVDAELLSAGVLPGDPSLYPGAGRDGSDEPGGPR